jgi:ribonuclease R
VLEIAQRKRANFTGEIGKQGDTWLAYPDGKELTDPVVIRDADEQERQAGRQGRPRDHRVRRGRSGAMPEAVITKVLGAAGEPDVETQAVIAAYSLPESEFPDDCVDQAREASREFDRQIDDWEKRGQAALDEESDRGDRGGRHHRRVHRDDRPARREGLRRRDQHPRLTAETASTAGSWACTSPTSPTSSRAARPLDEEAYERGNSCYLPRLVIPMLPEILSNGICSLQEGVPRFAKTAWMRYDTQGNVRGPSGVQQT